MTRLLPSMVAAAVTAAAATAAIAATTWGDDAPSSAAPVPAPAASVKVNAVAPDQAETFGVLRRPVSAGDAVDTDATGPFGANLRLARKVTADGLTAWVVPADQHLCLRSTDAGYPVWTCTTTDEAAKGNLVMAVRDPATDKAKALFALVPDGAGSGSLRRQGAADAAVTVKDNLAIKADTDATTLSYSAPGGKSQTIPIP